MTNISDYTDVCLVFDIFMLYASVWKGVREIQSMNHIKWIRVDGNQWYPSETGLAN